MAILINGPCLSWNYIAAICLVQTLTWDLSCLTFHWLTLVIAILNFLKLFSFKKTFNNFFSMFSKICPMSVSSNDCFFPYLERLFLSLFGTIVSFLIWKTLHAMSCFLVINISCRSFKTTPNKYYFWDGTLPEGWVAPLIKQFIWK